MVTQSVGILVIFLKGLQISLGLFEMNSYDTLVTPWYSQVHTEGHYFSQFWVYNFVHHCLGALKEIIQTHFIIREDSAKGRVQCTKSENVNRIYRFYILFLG